MRTLSVGCASLLLNFAYAVLIERPRNTEAVVGSRVDFLCRTKDPYSVNWEHTPIGDKTPRDVFISMVIVRPYDTRLAISANRSTGEYRLTIPNVQHTDAGRYECIDGAGQGERRRAELIVLESSPQCLESIGTEGIVGYNDCGLEPTNIEIQCTLRYSGNLIPKLIWHQDGGKVVIPKVTTVDRSSDLIKVTVVIKPQLEVDFYYCETSLSEVRWVSSKIKVPYAFNSTDVETINEPTLVTCSANSSEHCNYKWIQAGEKEDAIITMGPSIRIVSPGSYRCIADCTIRNKKCAIQSKLVEFRSVGEWNPLVYIGIPIAVPTIIALLVVFVSLYFVKRHNIRKQGRLMHSSKILMTSKQLHVQGLSVVGKKLFVIHSNHKIILIYNVDFPYSLREKLKSHELSDPRDLAATKSCLYITDAEHNCVWKMSLGLSKSVKNFIQGIESPFTISVNAKGEILMAENPNLLKIYNSEGAFYYSVSVRNISGVHQAVEALDGTFVMSAFNGKVDQIIVVTKDGTMVRKYEHGLLDSHHIAVGEERLLYVADRQYNQIVVLDRELNQIQTVPLAGQPTSLCYNDGQLLVGQSSGAIQFFGVTYLAGLRLVTQLSASGDEIDAEGGNTNEGSNLLHAIERT